MKIHDEYREINSLAIDEGSDFYQSVCAHFHGRMIASIEIAEERNETKIGIREILEKLESAFEYAKNQKEKAVALQSHCHESTSR